MTATFADALAAEVQKKGITLYRLAKEAGISTGMMSKLKAGSAQPSWETVQKIAKALGVTCEAFSQPIDLPAVSEARGRGRPPGKAGKDGTPGDDSASGRQAPAKTPVRRKRPRS